MEGSAARERKESNGGEKGRAYESRAQITAREDGDTAPDDHNETANVSSGKLKRERK